MTTLALTTEAKAIIWRIFGSAESPWNDRPPYDHERIKGITENHASSTDPVRVTSVVRGWFETIGDQQFLKSGMREPVASLILEGIQADRSATAVWAISSIEPELAAKLIRSRWTQEDIDSFTEAALVTLESLCARDVVLDPNRHLRFAGQDSVNRETLEGTVLRQGRLVTYWGLDSHGFELVHQGLYPAIGNLIHLMVDLRPEQIESVVERFVHPVIQVRAARRSIDAIRHSDHRKSLQWIAESSCDALIALAILHTLDTVNLLDRELRFADRVDEDWYTRSTELHHSEADFDGAATDLLTGLVHRLSVLDPPACVRWIGELLSHAPSVLHAQDRHGMPRRIEQLEMACTQLLARLFRQAQSVELLAELRAGLRFTTSPTWTRHIAAIAWELRDVDRARATEIARATLDEHERHVAAEMEAKHFFLFLSNWQDQDWFRSLGAALALSRDEFDLPSWVSAQCRRLPLSVWDTEENHEDFIAADRAVHHWFLVALNAIQCLTALGRVVDPVAVRILAEILWTHCHFAGQHLHGYAGDSDVAEYAARLAVQVGKPDDTWLLDQARHPGVGARAFWGLIDQRKLDDTRNGETDPHYVEMISEEFVRVASNRFGGGGGFNLESLGYWGRLWLLLRAANEAEQTAMAIVGFHLRNQDRAYKILALKLLAFAGCDGNASPTVANCIALLCGQLWSGFTPIEERAERQEIDDFLRGTPFRM